MTLLHMDGFDLGDMAIRSELIGGYIGTNTNIATAFGYGKYATLGSDGAYFAKNITPSAHVYTGIRCYPNNYTWRASLRGDSGATEHVLVQISGDGSATLQAGGTTRATAPVGTFPIFAWCYLEVEATISDTVGVVNVRLNGGTTPVMTYTGDTKNGGTSTNFDQVRFIQGGNNNNTFWDDWYICNDQGSANNGFLGDVRVYTLAPNGNGNYSQFVGSDGNSTDNYLLVDEQPYNTSDYVGSATAGNRDSYTLVDLPSNVTTVYATQELAVVAKNDAGLGLVKQCLRVNGTDYETSGTVLSPAYIAISNIREQNPNTSTAWTPSAVNGTEIGVRVG